MRPKRYLNRRRPASLQGGAEIEFWGRDSPHERRAWRLRDPGATRIMPAGCAGPVDLPLQVGPRAREAPLHVEGQSDVIFSERT